MAWAAHRVSGVALCAFVMLHVMVLTSLGNPEEFARIVEFSHKPVVRAAEYALLLLAASHALIGVRLTLMDLGVPARLEKPMFVAAATMLAALGIIGARAFFWGTH